MDAKNNKLYFLASLLVSLSILLSSCGAAVPAAQVTTQPITFTSGDQMAQYFSNKFGSDSSFYVTTMPSAPTLNVPEIPAGVSSLVESAPILAAYAAVIYVALPVKPDAPIVQDSMRFIGAWELMKIQQLVQYAQLNSVWNSKFHGLEDPVLGESHKQKQLVGGLSVKWDIISNGIRCVVNIILDEKDRNLTAGANIDQGGPCKIQDVITSIIKTAKIAIGLSFAQEGIKDFLEVASDEIPVDMGLGDYISVVRNTLWKMVFNVDLTQP